MKKIFLSAGAFAMMALSMVSCGKSANESTNADQNAEFESSQLDSVGYYLGYAQGKSALVDLNNWPGNVRVNFDQFLKGFEKGFKGDTVDISDDSCRAVLQPFFEKLQQIAREEHEAQMQKVIVENKLKGDSALAENRQKEGVFQTNSGLQYRELKKGTGIKPTANDIVKVHYTGSLLDGTVFDSSVERGKPVEFPLNNVIPGWTEGLQLMNIGSKYEFWIPSDLAYGDRGAGQLIQPGMTLHFEVELLGVTKAPEAKEK